MLLGGVTYFDLATRGIVSRLPGMLIKASEIVVYLGQGGPVSAIVFFVALAVAFRRRNVLPVGLWMLAFLGTLVLILPLKILTRRGAPADPSPDAVHFFSKSFCGDPSCQSYPSGHVAN